MQKYERSLNGVYIALSEELPTKNLSNSIFFQSKQFFNSKIKPIKSK